MLIALLIGDASRGDTLSDAFERTLSGLIMFMLGVEIFLLIVTAISLDFAMTTSPVIGKKNHL